MENYKPPTTIDELITKPIESGYLLSFCELQFSSENMQYIIEIDRFIDYFLLDKNNWNSNISYKQIDKNICLDKISHAVVIPKRGEDLRFGEFDWPSNIVLRQSVIDHIIKIWNKYISDDSSSQIFIPSNVLINTIKRMEYLHLYGKDIFNETLIDPIKTLSKDVLPRFLCSEVYNEMVSRMSSLYPLPNKSNFNFKLPTTAIVANWSDDKITIENLRNVDWFTLLHDEILFYQFLKYTQSIVSSENLLCARHITVFMALWEDNNFVTSNSMLHTLFCNGSSIEEAVKSPAHLPINTYRKESDKKSYDNTSVSISTNIPNSNDNTSPLKITLDDAEISQIHDKKIVNQINDCTFDIYKCFIISNSIYEISLSYRRKKEIMQSLASPTYRMFDNVMKSLLDTMKTTYKSYCDSNYFHELIGLIVQTKQNVLRGRRISTDPLSTNVNNVNTTSNLRSDFDNIQKEKMKCFPLFR